MISIVSPSATGNVSQVVIHRKRHFSSIIDWLNNAPGMSQRNKPESSSCELSAAILTCGRQPKKRVDWWELREKRRFISGVDKSACVLIGRLRAQLPLSIPPATGPASVRAEERAVNDPTGRNSASDRERKIKSEKQVNVLMGDVANQASPLQLQVVPIDGAAS